jgi:hypothetical protein
VSFTIFEKDLVATWFIAVIECRHPAAFTDQRPALPRGPLVDL